MQVGDILYDFGKKLFVRIDYAINPDTCDGCVFSVCNTQTQEANKSTDCIDRCCTELSERDMIYSRATEAETRVFMGKVFSASTGDDSEARLTDTDDTALSNPRPIRRLMLRDKHVKAD